MLAKPPPCSGCVLSASARGFPRAQLEPVALTRRSWEVATYHVAPRGVQHLWASLRAAAAAAQLAAPPPPPSRGSWARSRIFCTGPASPNLAGIEEAPTATSAAVQATVHTLFEWLSSLFGSLTISFLALVSLRMGILPRIHKLWYQMLHFLLRETPKNKRPFRQSFLAEAQLPLTIQCLLSVVCHSTALISMKLLSKNASQVILHYSNAILDLSTKICLGAILYGVVNMKITRSSRGIAQKSDILGAETSRQESQVLAVGQTARVLVTVGTLLSCLPVFKVNLGTVLSFCGMGGLAISLLSKGVFVNLIGSLTLYLTQPFTIGDWILTLDDEVNGWVQSMGPYHTVIMRWDRRPVYIPNHKLMQAQIINASRMTNRRIVLDVPVRFADLPKVDKVLGDIRDFITNHKDLDSEQHRLVRLRDISPHAAMIWVSCYTKGIKLEDFVHVREDVILGIRNIMFRYKMTFATTLERQFYKVNSAGLVINPPSGEEEAIMDGASPDSAAVGEEDVYRRPEPLGAAQKQELRELKQKQEALWVRERNLKDSEADLQLEAEELEKKEKVQQDEELGIQQEVALVEQQLEILNTREEKLLTQEEEIDDEMDTLQKREEDLDRQMKETMTKSAALRSRKSSTKKELEERSQIQQEKLMELAEKDKIIQDEREKLELHREDKKNQDEAEKLEVLEAVLPDLVEEEKEEPEEESGSKAPQEHDEEEVDTLDEAAQFRKIAESLGGE